MPVVTVCLRAQSGPVSEEDLELLDDTERDRASRRRAPVPFIRAHALLRRLVGAHTGRPPGALRFGRRCRACGSDQHGAPLAEGYPDLSISLSYCDDLALAALTDGPSVGCDVELVSGADFDGFAAVTLADRERIGVERAVGKQLLTARTITWARKEAILKATGYGLLVDPAQVVVTSPYAAPGLLAWTADVPAPGPVGVADVPLPDAAHRAAVAVLTDEPVDLRWL